MNKIFKLIYVNILNLFDINKIIIAREDGVKSNLEKRTMLVALIYVVFAYFLYIMLNKLVLEDNVYLLVIGFIVSTIYCLFSNITVVEPMIFKSDDIDFLLSYPVSRNQILFSKLFTIYLKNMLVTGLLMIITLVSYYLKVKEITDTLVIMVILVSLTIPLIPMVLSTIIAYINDYFKTKTHNGVIYRVIRTIILMSFMIILILVLKGIDTSTFNKTIVSLIDKLCMLYPITYAFIFMIKKESMLFFLTMLIVPIACTYLYTLIITNNYLKICSLLKGVKTNSKFEYKKTNNMKKLGGLIKKEFTNLFKNKPYFMSAFSFSISITILLIVVCFIIDFNKYVDDELTILYFNTYVPMILGLCGSIGCSTISSMSLEKDNMQILRTLPLSMSKILFSKVLTNVLFGLIFIVINGTLAWVFLDLGKWSIFFCYLIPLLALILVSLTGLILDYRFIEKDETEDNAIISQRLIVVIPMFIAIAIGALPFFLPIFPKYALLLGAYSVLMVIIILLEVGYLIIKRKKLVSNLFK